MSPYKLRNETRSIVGARVDYRKHPIVDTSLSRVGRGSGLTGPHRRTFATAILAFAHSMLTALLHPACDDQSAADRCPSNAGSRGPVKG